MKPDTYIYKTVSGHDIHADVYARGAGAPAPVLIYIHGGALIMGNRRGIHAEQVTRYLDHGYAVVSIDYRLAPETKLAGIVEDVADAVAWVSREGEALFAGDASRIGVVGDSAGGYLTLMSGFAVKPRPKALVSFYGYGDIVGDWYSQPDPFYCREKTVTREEADAAVGKTTVSEPGDERWPFYLYCRQNGLWPLEVAGHDPIREAAAFRQYCPILNVSQEYPPTMLLHGDKDTDVPYEQSVMMHEALAMANVEAELVTISGGEHGFDARHDDPVVCDALERAAAFFDRHLQA